MAYVTASARVTPARTTPAPFVRTDDVAIRLMEDDLRDYELLAKWLSDERVLEFFQGRDRPYDMTQVREKYGPRVLNEENVVPCLMLYRDAPIGYLQYFPIVDEDENIKVEDQTYGIDPFIGEPHLWDQGVGTLALSALLSFLFESMEAKQVLIDPLVSNPRAIRCYEKCGFKKAKLLPKADLHEGEYQDAWLMRAERSVK